MPKNEREATLQEMLPADRAATIAAIEALRNDDSTPLKIQKPPQVNKLQPNKVVTKKGDRVGDSEDEANMEEVSILEDEISALQDNVETQKEVSLAWEEQAIRAQSKWRLSSMRAGLLILKHIIRAQRGSQFHLLLRQWKEGMPKMEANLGLSSVKYAHEVLRQTQSTLDAHHLISVWRSQAWQHTLAKNTSLSEEVQPPPPPLLVRCVVFSKRAQ